MKACQGTETVETDIGKNMNAKCRHHRANSKKSEQKDAAATEDDGGAVPDA